MVVAFYLLLPLFLINFIISKIILHLINIIFKKENGPQVTPASAKYFVLEG